TAEPADEVATADTRSRADLKAAETELRHRMEACPEAARPYLLDMYANPVVSALKHSAMTG
ncbi:MAG TPA: glycerol acyltransferase, partial [Marinobacter sp.]|nr:glycerol acyltransferase [Marinobacter sp.]